VKYKACVKGIALILLNSEKLIIAKLPPASSILALDFSWVGIQAWLKEAVCKTDALVPRRFKSYPTHRGEIAIGRASCLLNSHEIHHLIVGSTPSLSAFPVYRDVIQRSRSLVLGTRSRRFKSYHPDHLPL
jgi:hypothetical protein